MKNEYLTQHEGGFWVDPEGRVMHPYYEWPTHSFVKHHHGFFWYLCVVSAFSALAVYFVFKGDFIPAIAIASLETLVLLYSTDDHDDILIRIDDLGVKVGSVMHEFDNIKKFWFTVVDEELVLEFMKKGGVSPIIKVYLNGMNYSLVRAALAVRCEEDEDKEEDFISFLGRKFKM
jgi:hypothetical protein